MSASQDEHASLPSRAQAGKRHSGDAHKTMGIWVESHDQHESNAEISGTIGAWEDVQFASPPTPPCADRAILPIWSHKNRRVGRISRVAAWTGHFGAFASVWQPPSPSIP